MKVPTQRVRSLRRAQTQSERRAWWLLRNRGAFGLKFHRQYPIGKWVADFYCFEARLAIELDGSMHSQPSQRKRDSEKDAYLEGLGIHILRVPNGLVLANPEGFLAKVRECALAISVRNDPSPPLRGPSPQREGYCHLEDRKKAASSHHQR